MIYLMHNPDDDEEIALTFAVKKKNLKREHFVDLAEALELTLIQFEGVFKRFFKRKQWPFH